MFRSALNHNSLHKTLLRISKQNRKQCIRWQSTSNETKSPLKVGLIVGSSVVVLSGVVVTYAKYDNQFRKKIQDSIPYSELMLNSMLGPIVVKESNVPSIESRDKALESSLLKKKQERIKSLPQSPPNVQQNHINSKTNVENNTKDNSQELPPNIDNKSEEQKSVPNTSVDNNKKKPESEEESPLLDMDVTIAKEALKEQLLNLLPKETENQHLKEEMQKRENDIELEYQRKIAKLQSQYEEDQKQQLKRQLGAFNDHLQEQLSTLRHELKRKHHNSLEEKLLLEKSRFQSELSDSFYRLQNIEAVLKAREELDKEAKAAKELWLLSQALKDALLHNRSSTEESCSPRSLTNEMNAVKIALNKDLGEKPLIKVALESIPNEVIQKGVYSEEDLIKRFSKVDRICKRVALIGDKGGSLCKYILSYLQSVLIFSDSKIPLEELEDKEVIDPSKWDTFDILTRVKHCLRNHNLEQALKYANQLRGEPRNVAQDWIRDTRTHLETRQAVDLLQCEAAAINVQVLN